MYYLLIVIFYAFSFYCQSYARDYDTHLANLESIHESIKYRDIPRFLSSFSQLQHEIDIQELARKYNFEPLEIASQFADNVIKKYGALGLTKIELIELSLFIQINFQSWLAKKVYYLKKEISKLARTIEFDPHTKRIFIHLKRHGIHEVGHGSYKILTYSIEYNHEQPTLVANCTALANRKSIQKEVRVLKLLKEQRGIVGVRAITFHKKQGNDCISIIFTLYSSSLKELLKNNNALTDQQKMDITKDLLYGLENMHDKSLMHHDLHAGNFLIKLNGERAEAAICDFGLTRHFLKDNKPDFAQAPRSLNPPDALTRKKKFINYQSCEVYALGITLYYLFYGYEAAWLKDINLGMRQLNDADLATYQQKLLQSLKQATVSRRLHLEKRRKNQGLDKRRAFEFMILSMLHEQPDQRPSAKQLRKMMESISNSRYAQKQLPFRPIP